jgi:hypothetical protein
MDEDPRLVEIERGLTHDDPSMAARLDDLSSRLGDTPAEHARLHTIAAWCLAVVVIALIILAVAVKLSSDAEPPTPPPTSPPHASSPPAVQGRRRTARTAHGRCRMPPPTAGQRPRLRPDNASPRERFASAG